MSDETLALAAIVFKRGSGIDDLLAEVVAGLSKNNVKMIGVLQKSGNSDGCDVANLHLQSINGDWKVNILEDRGRNAKGCRLSYSAIAEVAGRIRSDLTSDVDLLVLNRFGQAEAEGNGMRDLLSHCLEQGIAVLACVREDYVEAWAQFHGGLGQILPMEVDAIANWLITNDITRKPPQAISA